MLTSLKLQCYLAQRVLAILFLSMSLAKVHGAVIVETFETYPGTDSDVGWTNAWATTGVSTNLNTSDPINGGGQYLTVTSSGTGNAVIRRTIDSAILNTATTAHTISWDVRYDSLTGFNSYDDRLHFMANQAGSSGSDATASWLVGAVGGNSGSGGTNNYFVGNWYFYNNRSTTNTGPFNGLDMVDTGIAVAAGHTYSFIIEVDPASQTYNATVIDLTDNVSFTQTGLNFRDQGENFAHQHLVFGGTKNSSSDERVFSIDNLVITVPEPGRSFLGASAMLLILLRRRRRVS